MLHRENGVSFFFHPGEERETAGSSKQTGGSFRASGGLHFVTPGLLGEAGGSSFVAAGLLVASGGLQVVAAGSFSKTPGDELFHPVLLELHPVFFEEDGDGSELAAVLLERAADLL